MNRRDVPDLLTRLQYAFNVAHVVAPYPVASGPLSINPKLSSNPKAKLNVRIGGLVPYGWSKPLKDLRLATCAALTVECRCEARPGALQMATKSVDLWI
jgi:hypothetical protein